MTNVIDGFGFTGFRSWRSPESQRFSDLGSINLVAGRNNSGKSNVLSFLVRALSGEKFFLNEHLDVPQMTDPPTPQLEVSVIAAESMLTLIRGKYQHLYEEQSEALVNRILEGFGATSGVEGTRIWIPYLLEEGRWKFDDRRAFEVAADLTERETVLLHELCLSLLSHASGPAANIVDLVGLFGANLSVPIRQIGVFRSIRPAEDPTDSDGIDGSGLVQRLAKLQHPTIGNRRDKEKFKAIERLVQSVLELPTLRLEVPNGADTVHVVTDSLELPLSNIGTGLHQLILLAVACTLLDNHIICIEEPEVHLHPALQRKLIAYLGTSTSNQYIIATHSAHVLDLGQRVFHIRDGFEGSTVGEAVSATAVSDICHDLGYRPSDLLQANAVIWVEGPSDRIYLAHWLRLVRPDLVEGTHFSIMFYGGRLLNHLTADDPVVSEFISLRRLNRSVAIVLDSDRTGDSAQINATKRRVIDELAISGYSWETAGRAIENYAPASTLAASAALLRRPMSSEGIGRWERLPDLPPGQSWNKVKLAHLVCDRWTAIAESPLSDELAQQVEELVAFIDRANQ